MKKIIFTFAMMLILGAVFMAGCATTPQMTSMQKRQLTTRNVESSYENAFKATMTVLQDNDYIVKDTDMASGLIVAEVNRESSGISQFFQAMGSSHGEIANKGTVIECSATVGKLNDKNSEVRLLIQEKVYSNTGGTTSVKQIMDEKVYSALLNGIIVEAKRREALGR